jgi:hypothetical protein
MIGKIIKFLFFLIKFIYDFVMTMFKSNQKNTTNSQKEKDDSNNKQDTKGYESEDDLIDMICVSKEITYNNQTENIADMLKTRKKDFVGYVTKGNKITIFIDNERNQVEQVSAVTTEENRNIDIIISDDKIAAQTKVELFGKWYKITSAHVLSMIETDGLEGYSNLNNHVVVNKPVKNRIPVRVFVKASSKVSWFTYNYETLKYRYIETNITKIIPAQIKVGGRHTMSTIAIVVTIPNEEKLVYSGTIMEANRQIFVVTYTQVNGDGNVISIIAISAMQHDYTVEVKN